MSIIDFILHIDKHLVELVQNYGNWVYIILALIIFCETGLVVTPFLPGDSLLFIIGTLTANGVLDIKLIVIILITAALVGDNVNYHIGKIIGPRIFQKENTRLLNRKHLIRTHEFYEKHGGKTIILARFIPIVRTFAPFVAGIGTMSYLKFLSFSIVGAVLWVITFVMGGYLFGNIPFIKNNLTIFVFLIIFISVMPAVIGFIKSKKK